MTGHAPHKDAVVHLRSWRVHCSLFWKCEGSPTCCNPKTVSLVQESKHDLDTDSDTISDNTDPDESESDDC